ncbi:hypothetical protein L6164_017462 [Bauhinia variegata]|uniref:Uncharacterized protein n=1 Tax=Bauhinia variegata TaxID=167791 RepID=A0ACB9NBH9_BAUVA|nr:hypothetical protein L6164_017462 [Bauhinia variegata]
MLRNLRSRRRPRYGAYICAVISALLLLFSVSLLYTRLSHSHPHTHLYRNSRPFNHADSHSLVSDSDDEGISGGDDRIDELDIVEEDQRVADLDEENEGLDQTKVSGYFFDHLSGSIRKAFKRRSIEEWDDDLVGFILGSRADDRSKAAFGSDDVPLDEEVRSKAIQVKGIEDALLLKMGGRGSPLREGWGDWFDKKGDFLRRDRMFKSNWDVMNPLNNPMLQDPDGVGVTGLTRGDRIVQKWWMNEFKRVPFLGRKTLAKSQINHDSKNDKVDAFVSNRESRVGIKVAEHRASDNNRGNGNIRTVNTIAKLSDIEKKNLNDNIDDGSGGALKSVDKNSGTQKHYASDEHGSGTGQGKIAEQSSIQVESTASKKRRPEFLNHLYADGKRWGYYPGLPPHLTFTDFMDAFYRVGKCDMKVFMVWNSPPWMYTVRHQRGLESLLFHHRDACVVMFSETMELDFFKDNFLKDGYKVAVVMPNLDELLKDTPTHIFSSVWYEWRKTKFYSTHYSELVRLAALYRYGGIYLDSDIIVLKPISFLKNSVGKEDNVAGSALNGAVMAFRKHSPFIMECLKEFYSTYDDTSLRWNGADLLSRVGRNFLKENTSIKRLELNVEPSFIFFPISSHNIIRYFTAPATETKKSQQDVLFEKIMHDSLTFHFWSRLTSSLIPEPESLVSRLINHSCIRCLELM